MLAEKDKPHHAMYAIARAHLQQYHGDATIGTTVDYGGWTWQLIQAAPAPTAQAGEKVIWVPIRKLTDPHETN